MDGVEPFQSESNPGIPLPLDDDNGAACVLCQGTLTRDEEHLCVCGDCKFLLLEDFSIPSRHAFGGGRRRRRRRISTTVEGIIASEPTVIGNQFTASTVITTSSDDDRSRRWRVMLSDGENSDSSLSFHIGSESNGSFRRFHGDISSDANSVEGESEDDHSFLETGMIFLPSLAYSDLGSDSDDIDPMHAGPINWEWEGDEEDDEDEELEPRIRVHSRRRTRGGLEEFWAQQEIDSWGSPTPAARSFVNQLPRIVINKVDRSESSSSKEKESYHEEAFSSSPMCAICKDVFLVGSEAIKLPCIHLYHPSCILPWLSTRNSCPLCRFELPTTDLEHEESMNMSSRYDDSNASEIVQHYSPDENEGNLISSRGVATESREVEEIIEVVSGTEESSSEDDGSDDEYTDRNGWWFSRLTAAAPIVGLVGVVFVVLMGKPVTVTTPLDLRNQGRGGSRWQWQWPWL